MTIKPAYQRRQSICSISKGRTTCPWGERAGRGATRVLTDSMGCFCLPGYHRNSD